VLSGFIRRFTQISQIFLFCPQDGRDERLLVRAAFHAAAFERRTPNAELRTSK